MWVDGTQAGSTYSANVLDMGADMQLRIMGDHGASANGSGNLSNIRVVKDVAVQGAKGFWGTAGGFAASMGISLLVQGGSSAVSAYASSDWKVKPETIDNGNAEDGKLPTEHNSIGLLKPENPRYISEEDINYLDHCFNTYSKNFMEVMGDEIQQLDY
jgi:hypothetical protein